MSYFLNLTNGKELAVDGSWTRGSAGGYWEPPEPTEFEVRSVSVWDGQAWHETELTQEEWDELQPQIDKIIEDANTDPHFFGDD